MFTPSSGTRIANRYVLKQAIGRGGMGEVWEAHDEELDNPCAVKFISAHLSRDPVARGRLLREARAAARLRSPHAVGVLGVGEHGDAMYLAMELLEGETLAERLDSGRTLDEATALRVLEQTVHALDRAHRAGIVHRDLKPENLFLCSEPDPFVKILDFGVAKSVSNPQPSQTTSGALIGTPAYMSPEQARGDREIDHRSDLWALAIIAVECLGGRRPFEAGGVGELIVRIVMMPPPPLSQLAPALPAALESWWRRALAREPAQRFQSGAELVAALRDGLAGKPHVSDAEPTLPMTPVGPVTQPDPSSVRNVALVVSPRSPSVSPTSHTQSPAARSRRRSWLLASAGLAALALVVWLLAPGLSAPDAPRVPAPVAETQSPPASVPTLAAPADPAPAPLEAPAPATEVPSSAAAPSSGDATTLLPAPPAATGPNISIVKPSAPDGATPPVSPAPAEKAPTPPAAPSAKQPAPRAPTTAVQRAAQEAARQASELERRLGF